MIVLVTGATAGFGAAISRRFVKDGHTVIGVGRRKERLSELRDELGEKFRPLALDLADESAVTEILQKIPEKLRDISVLVNNAGLALGLEKAQNANVRDWVKMIQTNITGLSLLTAAVLPGMVERNRGHIINIGSVAGTYSQLYHTAIQLGIARAALVDLKNFVVHRARPWIDSGAERASDDTLTLYRAGKLQIDLHAVEELLWLAAEAVDAVRDDPTVGALAEASIAVAKAKVLATELALNASTRLLELAGAQATLAQFNLDRHWRNARTHTVHDPVRWKFPTIGDFYLNGVLPPRRGYI